MIGVIKTLLRNRIPGLYSGLQTVYYGIRKICETGPFGSVLNRVGWIVKHSIGSREGYDQASASLPHRQHIINHVLSLGPPESILEIGCGYGANLVNLSGHFPHALLAGIDVSAAAVAGARAFPELLGADLRVHDLDKPLPFDDNRFDVVISDAVLMFFTEKRLLPVLDELLRVSKSGVILHEYDVEGNGDSLYIDGRWVHDFRHACAVSKWDLTVEIFNTPFKGGLWSSHGRFLSIRKAPLVTSAKQSIGTCSAAP